MIDGVYTERRASLFTYANELIEYTHDNCKARKKGIAKHKELKDPRFPEGTTFQKTQGHAKLSLPYKDPFTLSELMLADRPIRYDARRIIREASNIPPEYSWLAYSLTLKQHTDPHTRELMEQYIREGNNASGDHDTVFYLNPADFIKVVYLPSRRGLIRELGSSDYDLIENALGTLDLALRPNIPTASKS